MVPSVDAACELLFTVGFGLLNSRARNTGLCRESAANGLPRPAAAANQDEPPQLGGRGDCQGSCKQQVLAFTNAFGYFGSKLATDTGQHNNIVLDHIRSYLILHDHRRSCLIVHGHISSHLTIEDHI